MTTNPLITEARKLDSLKLTEGPLIARSTDGEGDSWQIVNNEGAVVALMLWEDDAPFIAFAANNLLAFADKIEELQSEVSRVDSLRQRVQEALDDADGQLGEFFNTPSGAIIKNLQAQVEELRAINEKRRLELNEIVDKASIDRYALREQNTKLREACEAARSAILDDEGLEIEYKFAMKLAKAVAQLRAALEAK